jgi:phospholipid/cholesterol/gamma-HCH transport system permease protein
VTGPALAPVREAGRLVAFGLDTARLTFARPFPWRELTQQVGCVARACMLPAALVGVSFGAAVGLQLGASARQLAMPPSAGGAGALAVLREASPVVTALLVAAAGGSAICADLGGRKVRDEIDAMEVLGVSPVQRLVVPRVLASMLVTALLNGLVCITGLAGGYAVALLQGGGAAGTYRASVSALAQLPGLPAGELKALLFGSVAGLVAGRQGLSAGAGPKGVGDAVRQSVVITFVLLFVANLLVTACYRQLAPSGGG